MAKTFILSDESLNNHGFWLPLDKADLRQFKKNPVMLWMHNRPWQGKTDEVLPIGRWENIRIEKGQLLADAVFDEEDDFALKIASKVENDFVRMASLGVRIIATSTEVKYLKPGQTRETPIKWEVREGSIVDFGSNNNALALAFYDENDELINLSDQGKEIPLKILPQNTNQNSGTMKKIASLFNLAEDSSEDLLHGKVLELMNENETLKQSNTEIQGKLNASEQQLKDYKAAQLAGQKKEAETLLNEAVIDGRINADNKKAWENLFEKDHEAAKETILAMPKRKSIKDGLEGEDQKNLSERSNLEKLSWDELDKQGKLEGLKKKHKDLFDEKFEVKFGKKPAE